MLHTHVPGAILTIDIGTSSVKAGLFDRSKRVLLWSHRERLEAGEWVTDRWVSALQRTVDRMPKGDELAAIALSGNGPTVVPVGEDGAPLFDALMWSDNRERRVAGTDSFFLQKIRWIVDAEPELNERVAFYMTCPEYLAFLMGADPHTTSPSEHFDRYVWNERDSEAYQIDPEKLPPIARPGSLVGRTSGRAVEVFGLPSNVPVVAAGPDFLMSLLGTCTTIAGRTCDRAGTSEGINYCADSSLQADGVRTLPHVIPGLWNVAGILASTGRIFEWFRGVSRQRALSYDHMLAEIEAAQYEVYPYFFPSMNRGAAWEFSRGSFVGLSADHGPAQMGRAVVHAIGYAVRQSVERLKDVGCAVTELRACGGQARNRFWNQMKADIIGLPILCPEILDAELVGSFCCAQVGLGDAASLHEAAEAAVDVTRRYEPRHERHQRYTEGYERYLHAYHGFLDSVDSL